MKRQDDMHSEADEQVEMAVRNIVAPLDRSIRRFILLPMGLSCLFAIAVFLGLWLGLALVWWKWLVWDFAALGAWGIGMWGIYKPVFVRQSVEQFDERFPETSAARSMAKGILSDLEMLTTAPEDLMQAIEEREKREKRVVRRRPSP